MLRLEPSRTVAWAICRQQTAARLRVLNVSGTSTEGPTCLPEEVTAGCMIHSRLVASTRSEVRKVTARASDPASARRYDAPGGSADK
jgi:hypothetical protein